jgi:CheY-like chemotaxis protein
VTAGRRRILLVDDDAAVRDLVTRHLRGRGFDVAAWESAEEVLPGLRSGTLSYDVALTDVHLPGLSGLELSRLLLVTSPLRPVLLITGDDDQELARRALAHGATGYLMKPFQLFELDAALAQALSLLDLVETTEALARSQSHQAEEWGEAGGQLPRSWLHLGDEHSGAGRGHGARVVSIGALIANGLGDRLGGRERDVLRTAARTHEIGRLLGPVAPAEVARRTGQLLLDLGFDPDVAEVVRQAAEPWSPGLSLSARILTLADRLDHGAVERAGRGEPEGTAVRRAVEDLADGAGAVVDPDLVRVLENHRMQVESMWILQRQVGAG